MFQISVQDWPSTQINLAGDYENWGRVRLPELGGLAMGNIYSLDSKQERPDESPLECDEITYDEHGDDVVSLLEENARLRKLVFKLSEIILRNVVDEGWRPVDDL